jgi:hypothetical protein
MIQAKPGQIVLEKVGHERRKDLPSAPLVERTDSTRHGVFCGGATYHERLAEWMAGRPVAGDLVSRVGKWEVVTPAGAVVGIVEAETRETARVVAEARFWGGTAEGVLVRYVGSVVRVIRMGGRS